MKQEDLAGEEVFATNDNDRADLPTDPDLPGPDINWNPSDLGCIRFRTA